MNVLDYFNAMAPHIRGKSISELYSEEITSRLDYSKIQPGACLICGGQMDYDEMYPRDKLTPRATHAQCWQKLTSVQHSDCLVCGGQLDDFQIMKQAKFWGDLHNHIHDTGECAFYFSLCSAKVLGLETGIREERTVVQHAAGFKQLPSGTKISRDPNEFVLAPPQQAAITYEPQETVGDIIEMQQVRKPEPAYVRR